MNEDLRQELVKRAVQARMAMNAVLAQGETHIGYRPDMEQLHNENADFLMSVFDAIGWPGRSQVGDDGAAAAMMILQHASARPDVQRRGLGLMMNAVAKNDASPLDVAFLTDRIRVLEGKPQIFGTQLDWGADGLLHPAPIAEPEEVDKRRAGVGLGPLAEAVAATRAELGNEQPPPDLAARREAFEEWAFKVGWR